MTKVVFAWSMKAEWLYLASTLLFTIFFYVRSCASNDNFLVFASALKYSTAEKLNVALTHAYEFALSEVKAELFELLNRKAALANSLSPNTELIDTVNKLQFVGVTLFNEEVKEKLPSSDNIEYVNVFLSELFSGEYEQISDEHRLFAVLVAYYGNDLSQLSLTESWPGREHTLKLLLRILFRQIVRDNLVYGICDVGLRHADLIRNAEVLDDTLAELLCLLLNAAKNTEKSRLENLTVDHEYVNSLCEKYLLTKHESQMMKKKS